MHDCRSAAYVPKNPFEHLMFRAELFESKAEFKIGGRVMCVLRMRTNCSSQLREPYIHSWPCCETRCALGDPLHRHVHRLSVMG